MRSRRRTKLGANQRDNCVLNSDDEAEAPPSGEDAGDVFGEEFGDDDAGFKAEADKLFGDIDYVDGETDPFQEVEPTPDIAKTLPDTTLPTPLKSIRRIKEVSPHEFILRNSGKTKTRCDSKNPSNTWSR